MPRMRSRYGFGRRSCWDMLSMVHECKHDHVSSSRTAGFPAAIYPHMFRISFLCMAAPYRSHHETAVEKSDCFATVRSLEPWENNKAIDDLPRQSVEVMPSNESWIPMRKRSVSSKSGVLRYQGASSKQRMSFGAKEPGEKGTMLEYYIICTPRSNYFFCP